MPQPLISIIIPVFNGESFLDNCFSNLDKQLYDNLEIIFIDNNSTDQTYSRIKKYCLTRNNVQLLTCKKRGPAAARNIGLKTSSGEYITFLDVDDEILPNKFFSLLRVFEKYPSIGMACGLIEKKYDNGTSVKSDLGHLKTGVNVHPEAGLFWLQQFQHVPPINSVMYKKKIVGNKIYFPENLFFGEDVALNVILGLLFDVVKVDEPVGVYNRHGNSSLSQSNRLISIEERYLQFYEKFAIPYFLKLNANNIHMLALEVSRNMAFRLRMKLLFSRKNTNRIAEFNIKDFYNINKYHLFFLLFKVLPYRYILYIYDSFHRITIRRLKKRLFFNK